MLQKLIKKIVKNNLSVPAILFLEAYKPLSFVGSQALAVFQPVVNIIHEFKTYDVIRRILESREGVEYIIRQIEKEEKMKKENKNGHKHRQAKN
ncbi:MAG: hypothetical protein ACQESP_04860 [Candidatus Muiribacteriota bacterium]